MKANRRERKWQPLRPDKPVPMSVENLAKQIMLAKRIRPDISEDAIEAQILDATHTEMWSNDRYVVSVRRDEDQVWLSIRRLDRAPCRDWRDFQRIKNQLVGPECEAVELYPAESRLVDTANQFWLWCSNDPTFRYPIGFDAGRTVTSESGAGSVQRPLDEEEAA